MQPPFLTAQDVTELTLDLPIFLLQHQERACALVQGELLSFLNHRMSLPEDMDPYWDLRMGNALAVLATGQHPEALAVCTEVLAWVEDASLFLTHKALRLIETALEPQIYSHQAMKWLKGLRRGSELHFALSCLAVRSETRQEAAVELVFEYWREDALAATRLMALSKNAAFGEFIDQQLIWLLPFVRYLPLTEESAVRLPQHELWGELTDAWFSIAHAQHITPAWLNPALLNDVADPHVITTRYQEWQEHLDAFLLERLGKNLPHSEEEWLQSLGEEDRDWKTQFMEARQLCRGTGLIKNRGLFLVETPN